MNQSQVFLSLAFNELRHAKCFIKQHEFELARRMISIAIHYVYCFEHYFVIEQSNRMEK